MLETEFKKFGESFKMLERTGNIAIFKRDSGYEVVKIRVRTKDSYIAGKLISSAGDEYYPSNEDFGAYGWCHVEHEAAIRMYQTLVSNLDRDYE